MLNQDELAKISDDDINRRFKSVRNLIRNSKFSRVKQVDLQIEFCYLFREIEIRETRRRTHEEWVKENRQRRFTKNRTHQGGQ